MPVFQGNTRGSRRLPRGLLRPEINPDVILMLCTAGHVDHGKTALVGLLTGCNTDRLKAEQDRGLTIELGFAPCFLGGMLCAGIVDVPGHEKFVRTMVAGVSGIDMTILVIAADDGIMPQTVEHFQIMDLLGVRHGMIGVTKIDLVPAERVAEVTQQIRTFFRGTFLDDAPICPVSSETLDGYDGFYETLVEQIRSLGKRKRRGVFRMPIERTFTKQGFGSVVTGIPVDGTVRVGDEVEVVPGGQRGKIRGIQRFLRDASEGGFGQCLALNIPLVKSAPVRGQVVCAPGMVAPAEVFHVTLRAVPGLEKPIRHAEALRFHTGTAEVNGKVYLLEGKLLGGGETALASLVLSDPVAAVSHDRFILRRHSPAVTVGGGEILGVSRTARRPRKEELAGSMRGYLEALAGTDPSSSEGLRRRLEWLLRMRWKTGASLKDLAAELPATRESVREALEALLVAGRVSVFAESESPAAGGSGVWIHRERYDEALKAVEARIGKAREEGSLSLSAADLRGGEEWPAALWNQIQRDLARGGKIGARAGRFVIGGAEDQFSGADRELIERLVRVYEKTGFQSPRPEEAAAQLQVDLAQLERFVEYLCNEGRFIRVSRLVILTREHFAKAQRMVVEEIRKKGTLDSADFKYHIQSSRKYALAILDCLDSRRVTMRVGNLRKLAPDYERNLL